MNRYEFENDPSVQTWKDAVAKRHEVATEDLSGDLFVTKDSGQRVDYPSGMRRDVDTGKARYDLIPRTMLRRLAELYARGAVKYGDDNWQLADSEEELTRFKASAFRHFVQWLDDERDEDHGAAVFFNIAAAEHVRAKITSDTLLQELREKLSAR